MSAETPRFRDLDTDYDEALARRLYDLLVASFTPDELDDEETFLRGLQGKGEVRALATVALADGEVVGGVVGEIYATSGVLLLAYLAVQPGRRGGGLGTALLRHAVARWHAYPEVLLAVGEVHDPRVWSSPEDAAADRLRFYERAGARVLGVPFVQPALGPGRERVPGFLLLAFGGADSSVPSERVGRFVRQYYAVAGDAAPPAGLLAAIEQRPAIELYPVGDYERVPLLDP